MERNAGDWLRAAADVLLPRTCIVCGRRLNLRERHICLACQADLPRTRFWRQSHNAMADRFNAAIQLGLEAAWAEAEGPEPPAPSCISSHEPYAYACALFFYHNEAGYRQIPYQIKYHGNLSAGKHFGKMLGMNLASSPIYSDIDLIIPVPLHWTRRWKRGYNQAEVIASGVSAATGCPMRTDIMVRCRRTATQIKLDINEKARNVSGAFRVRDGIMNDTVIRHVLIVDDVFTTGATLHACYKALRTVLPPSVRISVATLGYVGR